MGFRVFMDVLTSRPEPCCSLPASSLSSVDLPDAGGPSSSVKRPGVSRLLTSFRMTSRFFSERSSPRRRKPHCGQAYLLMPQA